MEKYALGLYEKATPPSLCWAKRLELCRESGFDRLEISIDESEERLARLYRRALQQELRAAVEETGVPIKTMCLSAHRKYPFGSHDASTRDTSLEIMERALALAAELGIELIQLAGYDVYYEIHDEKTQRMFGENLRRAVDLATKYGVRLGFETMETPFMDTVGKAMYYVKELNSPWLGVYPDIGNLQNAAVLYGGDLVHDLRLGAGYIAAAHLKETSPGIYRNLYFGRGGHTDYAGGLRELWRQGVRSYTAEFWHQGEENYSKLLIGAAQFLREKITKAEKEVERDAQ